METDLFVFDRMKDHFKRQIHFVYKQTHSLDIRFNSPYVGDELKWNVKGKPKNGYKLIDGTKDLVTFFESTNTKKNIIKMNQFLMILNI